MRESLEMMAVKMSRILTGDFRLQDSWVDLSGYPKLVVNRTPARGWTDERGVAPGTPSVASPAAETPQAGADVPYAPEGRLVPRPDVSVLVEECPAAEEGEKKHYRFVSLGQKLYERSRATWVSPMPPWEELSGSYKRMWEVMAADVERPKPAGGPTEKTGRAEEERAASALFEGLKPAGGPSMFPATLGQKMYEQAASMDDPAWETLSRETKREWEIAAVPKPASNYTAPNSGNAGLSSKTAE
jgi:hypothetical protein